MGKPEKVDSSECQTHQRMYSCRSVEEIEEIKAFQVLMVHFPAGKWCVPFFFCAAAVCFTVFMELWRSSRGIVLFPAGVSGAICAATWW